MFSNANINVKEIVKEIKRIIIHMCAVVSMRSIQDVQVLYRKRAEAWF